MTTIETICNQALGEVGYKRRIGNIYDGTRAARMALDIWQNTRNSLFVALKPAWAVRNATLTLTKQAPGIISYQATYTGLWTTTSPEPPWLYEYQYPTDCIEILQIQPQPQVLPDWRPKPQQWRLSYDASMVRTILTNTPNAILVYIALVKDPNNWQDDFIRAMIMALAKQFQSLMDQPPQQRQQQQQQEQQNANAPG